jgi:hypothetical protein
MTPRLPDPLFQQSLTLLPFVARAAAVNSMVGLAVISSAVVPSCSQLLTGPYAESGPWQWLAAALDKAAGGLLKHSLQQPALAGAVCHTTATTMQVKLQPHHYCV